MTCYYPASAWTIGALTSNCPTQYEYLWAAPTDSATCTQVNYIYGNEPVIATTGSVVTSCYDSSGHLIWTNWNGDWYASEEVRRAENIRYEAQQQARLARELAALEATAEADKKAETLLKSILSPDQRAQYEKEHYFEVITTRKSGPRRETGTRRYRIHHGWAGNIERIDDIGQPIEKYCIHPATQVPEADNLIAQKLLLEADEEEFLRIANMTVLRLPRPVAA